MCMYICIHTYTEDLLKILHACVYACTHPHMHVQRTSMALDNTHPAAIWSHKVPRRVSCVPCGCILEDSPRYFENVCELDIMCEPPVCAHITMPRV